MEIRLLFLFFLVGVKAQSQPMNLGKLHWCDTLCLCHDDTNDKHHCFQDQEIYSLMQLDARQIRRLNKAKFNLEEKLMWCTEICLCHKKGQKEFKCTDNTYLGEFINETAPLMYPFLEPEIAVYDIRDIVDHDKHDKDRHDKKKNRKHHKNRKGHQEIQHPEVSETDQNTIEPENDQDSSAGADNLKSVTSQYNTKGEMTNELEELRLNVDNMKTELAFKHYIMLGTIGVASIAIIGLLVLAIYACSLKKSKQSELSQEDYQTRVHLNQNC